MADNNVRIVLQGFADASEAAYRAVVYLQCFLHNGAAKWNHVPSVLNPADLVSRGFGPCDLPNLRLWWHGPQFLEKDSDGLLRVGGRLSNSNLPYVNKHPAILPGNHNLTVQIIAHFHRKNLHTGASSLLHYDFPEVINSIVVVKILNSSDISSFVCHSKTIALKSAHFFKTYLVADVGIGPLSSSSCSEGDTFRCVYWCCNVVRR
ncbi:integrase_H2C2 domain-containing protein [Trichonephila clavipes]|nr:integrase_H2C2 domain-containing protein [Trichonephila clavipes]